MPFLSDSLSYPAARPDRPVDLVVVGGGIVGLSTALAAGRRDLDVRCFEAARPGGGQSAGRTRIFRHRHADEQMVGLAATARRAWTRWEERFGCELIGRDGVLVVNPRLEEEERRLVAAGVDVREVGATELQAALPAAGPIADAALLDVEGGPIHADRAITALVQALGERLVAAEVVGLHPDENGVLVATTEGMWRARHAVVCAGVDTPRLARALGLALPVRISCQLRCTFTVADVPVHGGLACLLDGREQLEGSAYGSPCDGGRRCTVGLSTSEVPLEGVRPALPPDDVLQAATERTSAYVREALPGLDSAPVEQRLCWATKLPWGEDAFAAWRQGPVTVLAGHNLFKFAPVLGDLLVDAATGERMPGVLVPPSETAPAG